MCPLPFLLRLALTLSGLLLLLLLKPRLSCASRHRPVLLVIVLQCWAVEAAGVSCRRSWWGAACAGDDVRCCWTPVGGYRQQACSDQLVLGG